ncbi:hypothetical protein TRFO_11657 [Tritrichomonas foetus]|uniref:non-specific serine/threonine protein kinase n=1 Tax=Tritrichomonas foetus TaxID=1144522 RepID=A0A1J4J668_9EUKA|nr:hypothetical protein TRFO_11657 [Tritrichomonas foetus]|eukprot:OHS93655.1 hypothetical protein TRFO_11657 [Tritrichomonas foetus]
MGNQIVIPSMGNWYVEPLKRCGIIVKSVLESGTFFLTLDCIEAKTNTPIIVKAYESSQALEESNLARNCQIYFSVLHEASSNFYGLTEFHQIYLMHNLAFLCRKKHQFTLTQRMEEYPPLEPVEKLWISYRIIKLVANLHELSLFHGAINPDNVFVTWDLEVSIGDMAPFKPSHIKSNRPDLFHHFFATVSRGSCYLGPEQILMPMQETDNVIFGLGTYSLDYFAAGLVIYFLYTGDHLFNFSSLIQYASGQISIENQLQKLPPTVKELVSQLLVNDPAKRAKNWEIILSKHFPSVFEQISNQFDEFFHSEMSLVHLIMMIPMFQMIIESASYIDDVRLIFVNVFTSFLNNANMVQEKSIFMNFICDFTLPLSDHVKLGRILPVFCAILVLPSNYLKAGALLCVLKLISSLEKIPPEFEHIFDSYLIKMIIKSGNGAPTQYRCAMASICPSLAVEIERLQPESAPLAIDMVNFVLSEDQEMVVAAFIQSMRAISRAKVNEGENGNQSEITNEAEKVNKESNNQNETATNETTANETTTNETATNETTTNETTTNETATNETTTNETATNETTTNETTTNETSINENNEKENDLKEIDNLDNSLTIDWNSESSIESNSTRFRSNSVCPDPHSVDSDALDELLHITSPNPKKPIFDINITSSTSTTTLNIPTFKENSFNLPDVGQISNSHSVSSPNLGNAFNKTRQFRKRRKAATDIYLAPSQLTGISLPFPSPRRCSFDVFAKFSTILLSCLNSNRTTFKLRILQVFRDFFDNTSPKDRPSFRKQYNDMAPLMLGFLGDEEDEEMIEGFLEFFLWFIKRNLLSDANIPDMLLKISDLRRHENPSIRYFASKIAASFPVELDALHYSMFLMDIVYQRKQPVIPLHARRIYQNPQLMNNTSNVIDNSGLENSPLLLKIGSVMNPRFIKSERLSTSPISIIAPHFNGNLRGLVCDEDGKLFRIKQNLKVSSNMNKNNTKISAITELKHSNCTLIVEKETRKIKILDWEKIQNYNIDSIKFPSNPVKIISKSRNITYSLLENCEFSMFDVRSEKFSNTMNFTKSLTPTDLCGWKDCVTVAVGFEEGIVEIIDTRMMLPLASIITDSVKSLAPCHRNCCNFVVGSSDSVECFDAFLSCSEFSMTVPNPIVSSYDGNVVITSDADIFYMDCENFDNCMVLGDLGTVQPLENGNGEQTNIPMKNLSCMGSLHKHASKITAADHTKELFMSGDVSGMLNLWALSRI